jgi:hypothetical protein
MQTWKNYARGVNISLPRPREILALAKMIFFFWGGGVFLGQDSAIQEFF